MKPIQLKGCFSAPLLDVMGFLSEVTLDFPDAISFATGSPTESFFDVQGSVDAINRFVDHRSTVTSVSRLDILESLGQYSRTNGLINDLIVRHLAVDEDIQVCPESVMVTSGYQEAMTVLLMGLFDTSQDVLLVSDPAYIGSTALASVLGIPVAYVPVGETGMEPERLLRAINNVWRQGKRPRALYDVPDFNNPLGTSLPLAARHEILEVASVNDMFIIEDNPYGLFRYEGQRLPTMKALDGEGVVVYVETFSKTIFPGLRVGFLVADQDVAESNHLLAEELAKIKGLTTVNTPPLLQAAVGGLLLEGNGSILPIVERKLPFYRANRDRMLARLGGTFSEPPFLGQVRWNRPAGGFFITVSLPFAFDEACFRVCAQEYGILCCPMSFFSPSSGREHQVRLSFSYVSSEQIDEGIKRLARFVRDRLASPLGVSARAD